MKKLGFLLSLVCAWTAQTQAQDQDQNVMLTEVPDYEWYAGCFGTAGGNMMGFWDRHGFPDFYTGPSGNGVAPLDNYQENFGIRALWASKAGMDGRPSDKPGHIDDYWIRYDNDLFNSYESTAADPYVTAGRPEHEPDCIGDFIGASQNKWKNLNGECDGNIDAYSFTFWDYDGEKRVNFVPPPQNGTPVRDIPSGLRNWTQYRGYDAEVFSQLADFNPDVTTGKGFTFADLKAEIDAGYPVMLVLQDYGAVKYRSLPGMDRANPSVHGMLAYGYYIRNGNHYVRYKTSWGHSGDNTLSVWGSQLWQADLPVRGVIGYHPLPKIRTITAQGGQLTIRWDGPQAELLDIDSGSSKMAHAYVIERADSVNATTWTPVSDPVTGHEATVSNTPGTTSFFRLKLTTPPNNLRF